MVLDNFGDSLKQTFRKIARMGVVDKEAVEIVIRDLQRALLQSDVDVSMVVSMCDKLKKELPAMGFPMLTPPDAESLLVVVQVKKLDKAIARLKQAGIQVTSAGENRMRISPAIYNNMSDIDRLLAELA